MTTAHYLRPDLVELSLHQGRYLLSTPAGGQVAIDPKLKALWEFAPGRCLEEISLAFAAQGDPPQAVSAGLACLAEAGLLARSAPPPTLLAPTTPSTLPSPSTLPLVSVVLVGYNSQRWLEACLSDLAEQTYQPLEILFVDNGSIDGSIELVRQQFPQVILLELDTTQPYSRANNLGLAAARGEYFLLLNPDVRLRPDTVAQFVAALHARPAAAAAAGKLKLLWTPAFLNGLGSYVGPLGWGVDVGLGHLDLGQFDGWEQTPSACFAAALIRRQAWETVGPLDEGFPMYYEDSEWSYRARRLGYDILAAPQAVVYHAFSGKTPAAQTQELSPLKLQNNVYGRLRFAAKITGGSWPKFLAAYLVEDTLRLLLYALRGKGAHLRAYASGWKKFLSDLRPLRAERRALHARQKRPGGQLFALQKKAPPPFIWHGLPDLTWDRVVDSYLPLFLTGKTRSMPEFSSPAQTPRLLIVSNDIVDQKMAGPGLRYLELAKSLAPDLRVTLAAPDKTSLTAADFHITVYQPNQVQSLQKLVAEHDIVLISSFLLNKFPFLESTACRLVVDLYDPFIFENLYYFSQEPLQIQTDLNQQAVDTLNRLARAGDFFICGSERQRDFWIGLLAANGRINPHTFAQDSGLHSLIEIVGVGIPAAAPRPAAMLKGVHPAFPPESQIVLWGGGIWNWLDPLTLIRSWPQVAARFPLARLVFLGTRHPNPLVPPHQIALEAEKLAAETGEKDKSIFFYEWLSLEDREALLCEADVGVTLHPVHAETRYSIRTRILDYFWAGLPVLITAGDVTSAWVEQYQVGEVVQEADPGAVAGALCRLLAQPKAGFEPAFSRLRADFQWTRIVQPLRTYCLQGAYAPDRALRRAPNKTIRFNGVGKLARAWYILKQNGWKALAHRVWKYLQWRLSQSL